MYSVSQVLHTYIPILQQYAVDSPALSAQVILAQVLSVESIHILRSIPNYILTEEQELQFIAMITRRMQGEPVAYIVEEQEFYGLPFYVTAATLIPRPETEELVEHVFSRMQPSKEGTPVTILDIGTGSGCISCVIARQSIECRCIGLDASLDALEVALHNAQMLGVQERFTPLCADLYSLPFTENTFSYIVANPPYLSEEDYATISNEVANFEPYNALVSGTNGLEAVYSIIEQGKHLLKEDGYLFIEFGCSQRAQIENYVRCMEWKFAEYIRDMSNHDRFCILQK